MQDRADNDTRVLVLRLTVNTVAGVIVEATQPDRSHSGISIDHQRCSWCCGARCQPLVPQSSSAEVSDHCTRTVRLSYRPIRWTAYRTASATDHTALDRWITPRPPLQCRTSGSTGCCPCHSATSTE